MTIFYTLVVNINIHVAKGTVPFGTHKKNPICATVFSDGIFVVSERAKRNRPLCHSFFSPLWSTILMPGYLSGLKVTMSSVRPNVKSRIVMVIPIILVLKLRG